MRVAIMSSGSKISREFWVTDEDIHKCSLLFCAPEAIDTSKRRNMIAKPEFIYRCG